MENYWTKALSQAWADTKKSFGLNEKTAATVLVLVGGWLVTLANAGLPNITTNLATYFWYGAPIGFAGIVLFVWNFVQVQGRMYAEISSKLANIEKGRSFPDPDVWRHVSRLTLGQAACLLADLTPPGEQQAPAGSADGWYQALRVAIEKGEITKEASPYDGDHTFGGAYHPYEGTIISRSTLKTFAEKLDIKRDFLLGS